MNRFLPALAVGVLWAAPKIVVDGRIEDWARVRPAFTASERDHLVQAVRVTGDAERIFIRFDFAKEQNIHALPGKITLIANSDGKSGDDISLDFSSGVAVSVFDNATATQVKSGVQDLGLAVSPTYAAKHVEVGFPRGVSVGARRDFFAARRVQWKLVVRDESGRAVEEGRFTSEFPAWQRPGTAGVRQDPLAKPANKTFRVVTWNVHNRFWPRNPEPYRRILRALRPDIVLVTEVLDQTPQDWMQAFFNSLTPNSSEWHFVLAKTGAWDRCVVATRFPLATAFDEVWHTTDTRQRLGPALEPLLPKTNPPPRKTLDDGVTAMATFVMIGSRTLLATALHLTCCDSEAGSVRAHIREAEAVAIAEKLRPAMQSRRVDGVLTGGDFNLVSTRRALDILRSKFDPAGGDLAEDSAVRLNGWSTWTNKVSPGARFMRSKLDYLLYSPSTLVLRRAFVFDSTELPALWQLQDDVRPGDSAASDHYPVVADFGWKE